jgi:enoyl-CoA hydratase/carnithine racemase
MTVPSLDAVLLRETHDAVAVLTLNRPAARNSLSLEMLEAMIAAF